MSLSFFHKLFKNIKPLSSSLFYIVKHIRLSICFSIFPGDTVPEGSHAPTPFSTYVWGWLPALTLGLPFFSLDGGPTLSWILGLLLSCLLLCFDERKSERLEKLPRKVTCDKYIENVPVQKCLSLPSHLIEIWLGIEFSVEKNYFQDFESIIHLLVSSFA